MLVRPGRLEAGEEQTVSQEKLGLTPQLCWLSGRAPLGLQ